MDLFVSNFFFTPLPMNKFVSCCYQSAQAP